jgi:hypothetical protein
MSTVRHFDGKAAATAWLRAEHPDLWAKTTVLWIAIYFQAWKLFPLAPREIGGLWVQTTSARQEMTLPFVDVRDTGAVVASILRGQDDVKGKVVKLVQDLGMAHMLETWGCAMHKEVTFHGITDDEGWAGIEQLGLKGYRAQSLVDLPKLMREFEKRVYAEGGVEGVEVVDAKSLLRGGEGLRSWEEFVNGEEWEKVLDGTGYVQMTAEY